VSVRNLAVFKHTLNYFSYATSLEYKSAPLISPVSLAITNILLRQNRPYTCTIFFKTAYKMDMQIGYTLTLAEELQITATDISLEGQDRTRIHLWLCLGSVREEGKPTRACRGLVGLRILTCDCGNSRGFPSLAIGKDGKVIGRFSGLFDVCFFPQDRVPVCFQRVVLALNPERSQNVSDRVKGRGIVYGQSQFLSINSRFTAKNLLQRTSRIFVF
jgi:hypothetical protein